MSRKICVITGTRAEYGLLRSVIFKIVNSPSLDLQLIATGMHLSPEFGSTITAIEADGLKVDRKVEMLLSSDTPVGITKSMGLGAIGFADALYDLRPDIVLVLGDRYEIFSAAIAAMIACIPIAHIHGGETTEGVIDEAIRHSITKMSYIHFVASNEYRRRVIQLGESPGSVFLVGGLGVDSINNTMLLERDELESSMNFSFRSRNLLITFHPLTLDINSSAQQMGELLTALGQLKDTGLIFTMPNSDAGGRELWAMVERFIASHPFARAYTSLGQQRYFSCMQYVDGVVGNSSSGISEAPSMGLGTINIGDRQRGRLSASSVIHCDATVISISEAIQKLYDPSFQETLTKTTNPYGSGGSSDKIVEILASCNLKNILKKSFYDLSV